MRVRWALAVFVMLVLVLPPSSVAAVGPFIDPRVPRDLYYAEDQDLTPTVRAGPVVSFGNGTFEPLDHGNNTLSVSIDYLGGDFGSDVNVTLELYDFTPHGWSGPGFDELAELPMFAHAPGNATGLDLAVDHVVPEEGDELEVAVYVPVGAEWGYYRVRVELKWTDGEGQPQVARSMGHFDMEGWEERVEAAMASATPYDDPYLVSEAGFSVVPRHYNYVRTPNRVPDLHDFTTPVIRPGESGTYNFSVGNRYEDPITDVTLEVSIYMWATIEEARELGDVKDPVPVFKDTGTTTWSDTEESIASQESWDVDMEIVTEDDTLKGTYFLRHRISFTYGGVEFSMDSRGYYLDDQWEGFDYSNLYYQLGTAGVIPDSSFSVKDPVPLWPLATLIVLCVLFGALAVMFYLADEHGDRYPRLKKALQYWTGKLEQRRRLMKQRLDELRREVDVPLEDDEAQ